MINFIVQLKKVFIKSPVPMKVLFSLMFPSKKSIVERIRVHPMFILIFWFIVKVRSMDRFAKVIKHVQSKFPVEIMFNVEIKLMSQRISLWNILVHNVRFFKEKIWSMTRIIFRNDPFVSSPYNVYRYNTNQKYSLWFYCFSCLSISYGR